ncbi:MAG: hypothetical protein WC342_03085 [Methanoregula sp.]|jgi:hypothetical protein
MTPTISSFTFEEVRERVTHALDDFKKQDFQLLELRADERAATHRIACYLQTYFPGWDVDCEYNRRGRDLKEQAGRLVRPDIIVHHRGIPENLLCIEAKKEGELLDRDKEKLKKFTDPLGKDKYQFGLLLVLSLDAPYVIKGEWYQNGKMSQSVDFSNSQDAK